MDGALAGASGQPPALVALEGAVEARLAADPGFGIEVTASTVAGGAAVAAHATLHAERTVARAGAVLRFVLVQDPVVYATPPGDQGETEFHWIMRDFVTAADPPLPLAPDVPVGRAATLTRQPAWPAADLGVVAFVQDPATREILQAGRAVVVEAAARPGRALRFAVAPAVPPLRTHTRRGRP